MASADYQIRPFAPGDRDDWLELYATVHGNTPSTDWFSWKYVDNPFCSEVPIFVAERNGRLVGSRPLFVLPIRYGDWSGLGFEHADAMVHPDHRREGVFTALVEAAIDYYGERDAAFFFSFPNPKSGGAHLKLGAIRVGTVPEAVRINRPGTSLAAHASIEPLPWIDPIVHRVSNVRDTLLALTRPLPAGITTRIKQGVCVDEVAALYRSAVPETLHTERSEAFLEWRFRNPQWTYYTLLGEFDSAPVAGLIVGFQSRPDGRSLVRITDILPLTQTWQRDVVLETLIGDVIAGFDSADVFLAPLTALPAQIASRWGLYDKGRWPLARLSMETALLVHPLDGVPNDVPLTSWDQWDPTFVEYDTA